MNKGILQQELDTVDQENSSPAARLREIHKRAIADEIPKMRQSQRKAG
jgi:hypothetical protein